MADRSSLRAVIVALAANLGIAAVKLIAAAVTGSAALAAETVHSFVDTGDEALLWVGLRRARRPADEDHPFGHGKELYFWALIVAMVVFAVGGGVSVYEGLLHLARPRRPEHLLASGLVLLAAAIFETTSFVIGLRGLDRYRKRLLPRRSLVETIHYGKDPSLFTVVLEDAAALAGLALAAIGIYGAALFRAPFLDGAASIAIGLLLGAVALLLGWESRGLLVGERAIGPLLDDLRALAAADPAVEAVESLRTMQLGPDEILVDLGLRFRAGADLQAALCRIDTKIRRAHTDVRHVLLDVARLR